MRSGGRVPFMPLSSTAWVAAAMAYWQNRSYLRTSDFSMYCRGSKSFTSAATLHLWSAVSKWVMGPMPHLPAFRLFQKLSTSLPMGVTHPIPVMTTRFAISVPSSGGQAAVDPDGLPGDVVRVGGG